MRPPCCCVSAGCQGNRAERSLGFGLSGWSAAGFYFPPLHLSPLSTLSSATGAAGGRWWVFCSLATPSVDGDWYAALFKCLSLSPEPERGMPEQSGPYWSLPSSFSLPRPQRRGRTNISAQRNWDSNSQQRSWKCNSGAPDICEGPPGVPSELNLQH